MLGDPKDQRKDAISPAELAAYLSPPKKSDPLAQISLEKVVDPHLLFEPRELRFTFSRAIQHGWTQKIRLWNLGGGNLYVSDLRCEKAWLETGENVRHQLLSGFPLELEVTLRPDRLEEDKDQTVLKIEIKRDGTPLETLEIPVSVVTDERRVVRYTVDKKAFPKTIDFGLIPYQDECEFRFHSDEAGKNEKMYVRLEGGSEGVRKVEMEARQDHFVARLKLDDGTYKYSFLARDKTRKNKLWPTSVYGGQTGVKISRDRQKKKVCSLDLKRKQSIIKFESLGTENLEIRLKSSAAWIRMTPLGSDSSAWAMGKNVCDFRLSPGSPEKEIRLNLDTNQLDRGESVGEIQVSTNSNLTGQREIRIPVVINYDYLLPTYRLSPTSFHLPSIHKGRKAEIRLNAENLGKEKLEVNLKDPPPFLKPTAFSVNGQSDLSQPFELDTGNLDIGCHNYEIELQTNGYPLGDQETKLTLCFEVHAYLADLARLKLGKVPEGTTISAEVSIKHSHGINTDFTISDDSKYSQDFEFGRVDDEEKDRFKVVFTANHQVPPNTVLSDHLELIDRISREKVKLPFEVHIV
jgi:hypothetical protein